MNRRDLLRLAALAAFPRPAWTAEERPLSVPLRKPGPYEALRQFIPQDSDEYACELEAKRVEDLLSGLRQSKSLPLASGFQGRSPVPSSFRSVNANIALGKFESQDAGFLKGLNQWISSLGAECELRFYVLPGNRIRVEASGRGQYRVAHWHMEWQQRELTRFEPLDEVRSTRKEPLFLDCSGELFGASPAWKDQLLKGVPYWRSRLDSACGIDIYGSNGISAADIDQDGWDEIYVSQCGGLPNRLFKRNPDGTFRDVSERSGLDLLDDTSCSLFADFRNAGVQDAVLLLPSGPLYFLNDGTGKFREVKNAFRFASQIQGTFTGMSAADYDRDGKLDLYLCTYVYFQSEDRYRYPVPYHDAQNGPPNFLFRNGLNADGSGQFEDVTESTGMRHNNNRYSFTASWCDYDGSGWPSLYVANDFGRNNLYKNTGGHFKDVAKEAGVEDLGPGMCASWFDFNGDGRPDLYVANMWSPAGQRVVEDPAFPLASTAPAKDAWRRHTKGNSLYRNRGDGTFEELPQAAGAAVGRWAWGAEGVDFDNDGVPEILVCAGMLTNSKQEDLMSFFWRRTVAKSPAVESAAPEYENGWNSINQYIREDYSWNGREPNLFYFQKDGAFHDCSGISGLGFAADTRTFAITDFDGDGNLDLLLKNRLSPQVRAFRNNSTGENLSICFSLHGTTSNRDGIGAIIEIESGGRRQCKHLQAGSGYLSQHTKKVHFGVGQEKGIQHAKITWPSGMAQSLGPLDAGFHYSVTEGSTDLKKTAFLARPAARVSEAKGDDSVRLEPTWLLEPVPLPERRKGPGFVILTDGSLAVVEGVPVEVVNLKQCPPDVGASYSLFRRYLFDWRAPLTVPLTILIDAEGRANKIYPGVPSVETMRSDLAAQASPDRRKLALPFAGWYSGAPARNYYKLGAAFVGAGYPGQALPYLEQAIRQWPENFKAWLASGQVHLELDQLPEARRCLQQALSLNEKSPEVWNNLGGVALREGQNEEALRCFKQMLTLAPDSIYGITNAAMALARLNRRPEAETLYRRALVLDPKDADTADRLGLLVGQQGRLDEAIGLFKQALLHDPRHASALNNLSVAYLQAGKIDDAIAALQYGIRVSPDHDILYLNLARVYTTTGNRERAKQVLEMLLERAPDNSTARKALQQLGEP